MPRAVGVRRPEPELVLEETVGPAQRQVHVLAERAESQPVSVCGVRRRPPHPHHLVLGHCNTQQTIDIIKQQGLR